jgi:MFS family permease
VLLHGLGIHVLGRFSLYGFLKNQRYHEPFFVLALREQGLSFLDIGLLVSVGSVCVNVLEVPFGAVADVYGRRRCLMIALVAYIAAFALFGAAPGLVGLYVAMLLYSVGEAFRGGTHKAMIFDWLRAQGREAEAADAYGFTRSWSKRGSAVSALVGASIALSMGSFTAAFWWTAIPYVVNVVNLAGYPAHLDRTEADAGLRSVVRATWDAVRSAVTLRPLRALLVESMVFEGGVKLSASYLQPLVQVWAVATLAASGTLSSDDAFEGTVIAAGVVYFVLGLVEAWASARAGAFARRAGTPERAVQWLWVAQLLGASVMLAALLLDAAVIAILVFVVQFGIARNLFRTVQLARYDDQCPPQLAATVLSLESQAQALALAVAAPLVGWAIDSTTENAGDASALWPAAAFAVVGAAGFCVARAFARPASAGA